MYDQYNQDNVILTGGQKVDPGLQMSNSQSDSNTTGFSEKMHKQML